MAIVDMKRISLIGFEKHQEQILDILMRMGVVEIDNIQNKTSEKEWHELVSRDGEEEKVTELDSYISKVDEAIKNLEKYNNSKKNFLNFKRDLERSDFTNIIYNSDILRDAVDVISKCNERLSQLRSEENQLESLKGSLEPWKGLDIPFEMKGTSVTDIIIGVIPATPHEWKEINDKLLENIPECTVETVNSNRETVYVSIIYHESSRERLSGLLKKHGFTKTVFKDIKGTAAHNINSCDEKILQIQKEREKIEKRISSFKEQKDNLEVFHDYLLMRRDRKKAQSSMIKTNRTFMMEGWVPSNLSENVKKEMEKHWDCIVELHTPNESEEFPVLLDNPTVVKPFELITELYSLPQSRGIDPNILMAPFYFIFFGMMISDAGYGFLIALLSGLALLKFKPSRIFGKLLRLLFLGGISTFAWGVLFGGWFGNITELVTSGNFTLPPLWFNPLDDPMRLLIWSLVFGGIHLFTGMAVKAYILIKKGKVLDAVFDIGFWYILLIGLVLMFAGGDIAGAGKFMSVLGGILLILTQGRNQKGIIKKFFSGILSLYNVTGYLSDVLSYSRLLALGLATGVIASVINTVGILFGLNIIGILLLIIIFIVGHVFNILINALGAYVHASRLQYVEFFSKFYEGGGKAFKPFKINTNYINLK
jgi:V/A-type H+/Na+-transporting ATPase subunit I